MKSANLTFTQCVMIRKPPQFIYLDLFTALPHAAVYSSTKYALQVCIKIELILVELRLCQCRVLELVKSRAKRTGTRPRSSVI